MTYEIKNMGEAAYLPQVKFTSSTHMPFAKIPSTCKVDNNFIMLCDLNNGQPLKKGKSLTMDVLYDSSNIKGNRLELDAEVFSTGDEKTPTNNKFKDIITLLEFTEFEAFGASLSPEINLEKISNITKIENFYEIKSNGPSTVGTLEVVFHIPVAYRLPGSKKTISIINEQKIFMQAEYNGQLINVDFYENNTQILMNAIEYTSSATRSIQQDFRSDSATFGHFNIKEINAMAVPQTRSINSNSALTLDDDMSQLPTPRRRRDVIAASVASNAAKKNIDSFAHNDVQTLLTEEMRESLPKNRTIVFNCRHPETTVCVRAVMRVYNMKPDKQININMKYQIDLNEVDHILTEPWEVFIVLVDLDLARVGSVPGINTISVKQKIQYNIIWKYQLYSTPIWLIILAILAGLLLLALMTYGMYKLGFFKRVKKDEMEQLVQGVPSDEATETANLNSRND